MKVHLDTDNLLWFVQQSVWAGPFRDPDMPVEIAVNEVLRTYIRLHDAPDSILGWHTDNTIQFYDALEAWKD